MRLWNYTVMHRLLLIFSCCLPLFLNAQVTISYQGGEPGDPWTFITSGASALAQSEALSSSNKTSGTTSLVAGGNTGGGNCFASGSGNGPSTARYFSFSDLDISQSNGFTRTLTFNWGNRFPACNGTGWDSGENLTFTAYLDGVAQPAVTLAVGNNNAQFSILTHQHSYTIPPCVNSFRFVVSVTTNRADELLFIDDVTITAPQSGNSIAQPSPISGLNPACVGSTATYSVTSVPSTIYTWSGLPAGAQFTTPNGTTASSSITIDWGTTPPGTYTISVTPSNNCGGVGTPQTLDVTIQNASQPAAITGDDIICTGGSVVLQSNYTSGNVWSTSETTSSITVSNPGTYTLTVNSACGNLTDSHTVTAGIEPVFQPATIAAISCFGAADAEITANVTGTGTFLYALDNSPWQSGATFGPLGPGNYVLTAQSQDGCEATQNVLIDDAPEIVVTASNDGPVCDGEMLTLQAGTTNPGQVTYEWSGPNGYLSNVQNPTDATTSGTYTVIAQIGNCSSDPVQTSVTIIPVPDATASNTGPYCEGEAIFLNGNSSIAGTTTYEWNGPGTYISSQQNPVDATLAGTYNLTVVTDGCTSAPITTEVVINPIPIASASYNAPYCPGTPLTLYGAANLGGTISYMWTGPNGYQSNLQNPGDATETGMYQLVVSAEGCNSQPATTNVIAETPSLQVAYTGPACEGIPVNLISSTDATGTLTYVWSGPNGFTSTNPQPSGITDAGTYTLTMAAGNCIVQNSIDVVTFPVPIAAFVAPQGCYGTDFIFQSDSYTPGMPSSIEQCTWDFGDGTTTIGDPISYQYEDPGSYPVHLTVQNSFGCTGEVIESAVVFPTPIAQFSYFPDEISEFSPTLEFTNESENADTYVWHIDTTEFIGWSPDDWTFHSFGASPEIQLIASNSYGCIDSITVTIPVDAQILYYIPNAFTPDGNEYNNVFRPVISGAMDPYQYELNIYNRWGELIFQSADPEIGWDGSYSAGNAENGTYIWTIELKHTDTGERKTDQGHVSLIR